jgi:hypothetical protein
VRSHVKASFAASTQASNRRQARIGLACLTALGLVAFLGFGAPSASAVDTCPNVIFRTGPSAKLPECRAYELVSPTYTGSLPPTAMGLLGDLPGMFATDNVTPAGDSVVYNTIGGALSGFSGTGSVDRYRARRGAQGWVTEPISPGGEETVSDSPGGISPDHEYAVGSANGRTEKLWPPLRGAPLMYLRTPNGYEPLARGSLGDTEEAWSDWITPGATHIIFTSKTKLEPNAPEDGTQAVYDRTPGGPTHVISLLPDGAPLLSAAEYLGEARDGSEVAFTPGFLGETGHSPVYVRRNNTVTKEVIRPGGIAVGKELKCTGGPGSATLTYRWLRNGSEIGGATSSTYTTTAADEGSVVQCQVTASSSEGASIRTSETRLVEPYQGKTFPTQFNAFVTPSGSTAAVGSPLTCSGGGGGFTVAHQWFKDGTEIGGATSSTYTPVEADAGHSIQCRVAVSNSEGISVGYSSAISISGIAPKASANPAISSLTDPGNAPEAGDELSCSQGTWSASPSFAYQWLRDGAEIAGSTSNTYTVEAGDDGKALQCRVTATNAAGSTQAVSKQVYFTSAGPSGETHPFLETFGSAAQPGFGNAEGLAVDQSSGDLLVIDSSAGTVSRYNPDGTPANFSALGTNMIDGKGTGDGTPQNGLSFGGPEEAQIAVDNSGTETDGDIYVVQNGARLVDVFASSGAYLGKIDQYKQGPHAEGELAGLSEPYGVAVDPDGAVYVSDFGPGIHKYVPSANPPVNTDSTANFSYGAAGPVAAGSGPSAGFIFADTYYGYGGHLRKLDSSTGEEKYELASGVTTVSVDPTSGHVYAAKGAELEEFDASGTGSASTVSTIGIGTGQGVAIRGSSGNVYVSKVGGANISVFGPAAPAFPEPPELLTVGNVSGGAQVGNSLSCATGSWSGSPAFTRQWLRNGAEIPGKTEGSYALTAEDLGTVVQCRVTATNANGSTVAINAGEGVRLVSPLTPSASASLPDSGGSTFDGIFNGRVFYTDTFTNWHEHLYSELGNLYMYDLDTEKTSMIANSGDAAIVNVSEDGSHVYFISKSLINGEGEAGEPNLGVWSAASESAKFIATVSEEDVKSQGENQTGSLTTWWLGLSANTLFNRGRAMDHSRTTPDGKVFAFESTAQLTGFDNMEASAADCGAKDIERNPIPGQPCDEVYRYDTESEELICVSCGPGAGPATGNARLQTTNDAGGLIEGEVGPASINTPVESLTSNGDTLFFESTEGLLPQDGNGNKDVYRWKKGEGLALISTGQSTSESALYGVTPSGSDVIFATREKLLPQDENGSTTRLYDARVQGGFPPPEETVTEICTGDSCQPAPSAAPSPPNVASSSLNGGGNVAQKPKCGKHARRVVRKGSERCVQRKHHKHRRAHHERRAAR